MSSGRERAMRCLIGVVKTTSSDQRVTLLSGPGVAGQLWLSMSAETQIMSRLCSIVLLAF